jgi:hypothetical protein
LTMYQGRCVPNARSTLTGRGGANLEHGSELNR